MGSSRRRLLFGVLAGIVFAAAALAGAIGILASPAQAPSADAQYPPKKITICHKTGSRRHPFVTIRVARSVLRRHLRHRDTVGPCSRRLNASVTAFRLSLVRASGGRVRRLGRGSYTFAVTDRTAFGNFHLRGNRLNRHTGIRFRGFRPIGVTLGKGVYRYGSDTNSRLGGSFRVR